VNSGHETFDDSELVVQDLGERSQTVGGARGVGNDGSSGISLVVYSHDVHGGISRRSRDDDLLGASLQVSRSLFNSGEDSSRLADYIGSYRSPGNVFGVSLGKELDLLSIDNEAVSVNGDFSGKSSVNRVVLELISSVLNGQEGIVNGNNVSASALNSSAGDETKMRLWCSEWTFGGEDKVTLELLLKWDSLCRRRRRRPSAVDKILPQFGRCIHQEPTIHSLLLTVQYVRIR
jgi:hypothetical protein